MTDWLIEIADCGSRGWTKCFRCQWLEPISWIKYWIHLLLIQRFPQMSFCFMIVISIIGLHALIVKMEFVTFWPDSLCFVLLATPSSVYLLVPEQPSALSVTCCVNGISLLCTWLCKKFHLLCLAYHWLISSSFSLSVYLCLSLFVSLSLSLGHIVIIYYQILIICNKIGHWKFFAISYNIGTVTMKFETDHKLVLYHSLLCNICTQVIVNFLVKILNFRFI